jgi:hypothetical protein
VREAVRAVLRLQGAGQVVAFVGVFHLVSLDLFLVLSLPCERAELAG